MYLHQRPTKTAQCRAPRARRVAASNPCIYPTSVAKLRGGLLNICTQLLRLEDTLFIPFLYLRMASSPLLRRPGRTGCLAPLPLPRVTASQPLQMPAWRAKQSRGAPWERIASGRKERKALLCKAGPGPNPLPYPGTWRGVLCIPTWTVSRAPPLPSPVLACCGQGRGNLVLLRGAAAVRGGAGLDQAPGLPHAKPATARPGAS